MAEKQLTWQQKVEQGLPLNALEQVKQDAYVATTRRMREQEEDRQLAQERAAAPSAKQVKEAAQKPQNSKEKGE